MKFYNLARSPFIGPLLPNTRMIPLTQGQCALVDEEDYEDLNQFNWCARWNSGSKSYYALRNARGEDGRFRSELMHQRVTGFQWKQVDHIFHDTLDNRKSQLRDGSSYNARNMRLRSGGSSQYHGVSWSSDRDNWEAQIRVNGRHIGLGRFDDELEAAKAYNAASLLYHGEYGTRNQLP